MPGSGEVGYQKRACCKEECNRDIARQVAAARWERYDAHHVGDEDEEETGKQVGRVSVGLLAQRRPDHLIIYVHHKHVHQSCETLGSLVCDLVLPAPACGNEDAQQQEDRIDEEYAH